MKHGKYGFWKKILCCAVVTSMLAVQSSVFAFAEANGEEPENTNVKNTVNLGLSGLTDPDKTASLDDAWSKGKGSYLYFGQYFMDKEGNKKPIKWRVLSTKGDSNLDKKADAITLQSNVALDMIAFDNRYNKDDDEMDEPEGYERHGAQAKPWIRDFNYSNIKKWLNSEEDYKDMFYDKKWAEQNKGGFLNNAFSEIERNLIKPTSSALQITRPLYGKPGDATPSPTTLIASKMSNTKVFLLSAKELENAEYGYSSGTLFKPKGDKIKNRMIPASEYARTKLEHKTSGLYIQSKDGVFCWTRSHAAYGKDTVCTEGHIGSISLIGKSDLRGYRFIKGSETESEPRDNRAAVVPAMNIDKDAVLLSKQEGFVTPKTLKAPQTGEKKTWSVVLKDNTQKFEAGKAMQKGSEVTVPFKYTYEKNKAERMSVLITDKEYTDPTAKIKSYGSVAEIKKADDTEKYEGEVKFTLPENYNADTDKVYVFAEKEGKENRASLASEPKLLTIENLKEKEDKEAADKVSQKIEKLNEKVTLDKADEIRDAKKSYDELTEDQRKLVTNVEKLNKILAALDKINRVGSLKLINFKKVNKKTYAGLVKGTMTVYKGSSSKGMAVMINTSGKNFDDNFGDVKIDKKTLVGGIDYKISGKNLTVTLKKGTINKLKTGKHTLTVVAKTGIAAGKFRVVKAIKLSKCKVKKIAKRKYTGKKINAKVQITYKGKTLKKNVDYKLSYKNNRKVGKAKVVITGIGRFQGKLKRTFNIYR